MSLLIFRTCEPFPYPVRVRHFKSKAVLKFTRIQGDLLCPCVHTDKGCFKRLQDYLTAFNNKKERCQCCLKGKENKEESYQIRRLRFLPNGSVDISTERSENPNPLCSSKDRNRKAFESGFPMQHRGVFLVVVNNDHCVVFDASRQLSNRDTNYMLRP